jgi:precorrin-6B methylase 2
MKTLKSDVSLEYSPNIYKTTWPLILVFIKYIQLRKRINGAKRIEQYSRFWDGLPTIRRMREGAARWPALDAVYNYSPREKGLRGVLEAYYLNGRTCQALRNRYKIVVEMLEYEIERSIHLFGEARILSLAAGTCQSVFEASSHFDDKIKILAVDSDSSALPASKLMALKYGISNVEWRMGNVLKPHTISHDFDPTIIEVVGLFDYLSNGTIRILLQHFQNILVDKGAVVTAHIHHTQEAVVLKELLDWDMTYRSISEFIDVMSYPSIRQSKFITEPHGIFTVMRGEYC